MFSPGVQPVREEMIQSVFGLERSDQVGGDGSDEVEDSEIETEEPEDSLTLGEDDLIAHQEIQDLEEHFNMYQATRYNLSIAAFTSGLQNVIFTDYASVQSALSPTDPETRHILYRLSGFQSLIHELQPIQCLHPRLLSQRDDLVAASRFEIQRMLTGLQNEWDTRAQENATGLRRVSVDYRLPDEYTSPLVMSVVVLVSLIHTLMGVARNNCGFILSCLRSIISMAAGQHGNSNSSINDIPITLATALHRLNLSPAFDLYATCPKCSKLYPQFGPMESPIPEVCTAKNLDGVECGETLGTTHRRGDRTWQRPISRYSHMRFETWVSELLLRPEMEDLLEAAGPNLNPGLTASDVWDAPYLRTFPNPAEPFMDPKASDLRLVMMLHFDFFNPFTNKTAGKVRSVGCFFMICLNLPPDIRYSASNAYLVAVVPGPHDKRLDEIDNFIKPIVDDMIELYSPGIWISKTHKHPRGRQVRAAIAIKSMDILAARQAGGFASHSHTCFCHLCTATRAEIDRASLQWFQPRTAEAHRQMVQLWENAPTIARRKALYDKHGVRSVSWSRFAWWDPQASIVVGPMHWSKNMADKQLRQNMEWSWDTPFGIPDIRSRSLQPITTLEYEWGTRALVTLNAAGLKKAKLTAPLLHYLCRQRGISEAVPYSTRLIEELNKWRTTHNILSPDGELTDYAKEKFGVGVSVGVARAHFYVSRHPQSASTVDTYSTRDDLAELCRGLGLPSTGQKANLIERLLTYYHNTRVPEQPNGVVGTSRSKPAVAVLGREILKEVKEDMGRTILPSWIKRPPINFATLSHGKIQAEEYKALVMVSFTITLIRLWGLNTSGADVRERLDNFLHLMLCIRILAFQSLTDFDCDAFDRHYEAYMIRVKELYPTCSIVPVQHLGLHISQFLRSLGPSTRWSESTCEQFIGMFQNITTNFKFGDLELTLHREFVMAARLKGMMENLDFTSRLGEFGQCVRDFLRRHVPGLATGSWKTSHSTDPIHVPEQVYQSLADWANRSQVPAFPRRLFVCTKIQLGNVAYTPYTTSSGDSCVLFSPPTLPNTLLPGRIYYILEEPSSVATQAPRIALIVRAFKPLTERDAVHDPYRNHPIVGLLGAGIIQLYYSDMEEESHLIAPKDLVSHVAVCSYIDPHDTLSQNSVVILSLDLKHDRYT